MIRLLLISNQHFNKKGVGNPIMYRMKNSMQCDSRIEKVDFLPFFNKIGIFREIRNRAKYYDIIHIHFGGLYALMIWCCLVGVSSTKIITFHGTDIHAKQLKTEKSCKRRIKIRLNQWASFISIVFFDRCGFVAEEMVDYLPKIMRKYYENKFFMQPLGVDYTLFKPVNQLVAQSHLGMPFGHYVLFSDISNTSIKRRDIATSIIREIGEPYKLLIMSGVVPEEVPYYINACDFAILTSDEEGSPNIIREVLSLNKPFFSVNVGDASKQLCNLNNSTIISRNPKEAANIILQYMSKPYTDFTRTSLQDRLDFVMINKCIVDMYMEESL